MNPISRRSFIPRVAAVSVGLPLALGPALAAEKSPASRRRMTMNLVCGAIGVSADQRQAIDLAAKHGFESVEAYGAYLASLGEQEMRDLLDLLKSKGLVFGAAGLPVEFRRDDSRFEEGLKELPAIAKGLQRAGVTRVGTWISPAHDTLTYLQNFKQHVSRLRRVAEILKDHGQRLGLEYVGTPSLRAPRRFPFVHNLPETKELIAEIGTGNVGFVLDSWHWWTARDTQEDILSLRPEDIVAVDLNDAPAGIPLHEQRDNRRELPMATGVIDTAAFLRALHQVGYDGPVRAEPFNQTLNRMDNDAACAATIEALKKAFALLPAA